MRKSQLLGACCALAFAGAGLVPVLAADAAPVPPAPPAPVAPAVPLPDQAQIDAQLQAAQQQLEQAAHEVARLSTQLSSSMLTQVMPFVGAHVLIGVQLEPAPGNLGARVREVSPGGAAAEAGVQAGDVILAVNGTEIKGDAPARQVSNLLRDVRPDAPVRLRVQRDGKPLALTVTARAGTDLLAGLPHLRDFGFEMPEVLNHRSLRDLELVTLTPGLGSYFGTDKGVLVVRAPPDGALKLQDGDVILAIGGREPMSGSHATRILGSYQSGEKITLHILRQHKALDLETALPQPGRQHDAARRAAQLPQASPRGGAGA